MPPPSNPPANRRVTRASKPRPPPPSKDNSPPVQAARPAPRNITTIPTLRRSRSKSLENANPPDPPKRVIRRSPCVQCVPRIAKGKIVCCEVGPICRPCRLYGGRCETIPRVGDTCRNAGELAYQAIENALVGITGRIGARHLKPIAKRAMISLNRVRGPATDPLSDYEIDDDDGEEERWLMTLGVKYQTPVQRDAQQVQEDGQNEILMAPQGEGEEVQDEAQVAPQEKEESEDEDIQDEIRVVQEGEEEDGEEVLVKQEGVEAESDNDMEHQVTPDLEGELAPISEEEELSPGPEEEVGPRLDDEVTPGLEEEAAPALEGEAVVPAATPMEAAVSAISNHSDPGMIAAVDRNTTALNRLAAAQEEHNRLLALQLQRLS